MLKKERLQWILEKVNTKGVITVNDVIKELGVSDMTVRRDLDELDKDGLLIRIHGGAQSIDSPKIRSKHEKSNTEKQELQIEEKRAIAKFASQLVQEGETIFIGPGTTLEHFASELVAKNIRVITNSLPVFNILNEKRQALIESGKKIYNMSVGTPDFPPAQHVLDVVSEAAKNPEEYKYSLGDTGELLSAVEGWYQNRYGVTLQDDEILSLAGSQEGFAHVALTLCDPGDVVLVPNPGYPVFEAGPFLNDAKIAYYELDKTNHYAPALDKIPEELAKKAKMMVVSYPLNPTCTCIEKADYEKIIAFAKKYNIAIIHDNAYSEIEYDGRTGFSFLSVPGAKEVGIEFNSLSKTYNLTGIRISFALGNKELIQKFKTVRSQFDYGTSFIVQKAAVAALTGPQDGVRKQCAAYEERRDALCGGLNGIGWQVPYSEGTMFVWAPLPKGYTSSEKFCMDLLENTGVLCTPGSAFGSEGEGHVRFALVLPPEEIKKAVEAVGAWL